MGKGRKVPPQNFDPQFKSLKEEMEFIIRGLRQSDEVGYQAIEGMALNQKAIEVYQQASKDYIVRYSGLPPSTFDDEPGVFIYLLKSNEQYKVGVTKDIPERIKSLQTGNPNPIELESFCIVATEAALICEREVHKHFATRRGTGEWFKLTSDDVLTIKGWFRNGIPIIIK